MQQGHTYSKMFSLFWKIIRSDYSQKGSERAIRLINNWIQIWRLKDLDLKYSINLVVFQNVINMTDRERKREGLRIGPKPHNNCNSIWNGEQNEF